MFASAFPYFEADAELGVILLVFKRLNQFIQKLPSEGRNHTLKPPLFEAESGGSCRSAGQRVCRGNGGERRGEQGRGGLEPFEAADNPPPVFSCRGFPHNPFDIWGGSNNLNWGKMGNIYFC